MDALEIIALILIGIFFVKLIVISKNPRAWLQFWKKRYAHTTAATVIALALAAIVLYFLLQQVTITQIMAVAAFMGLLFLIGFLPYINEMFGLADKWIKEGQLIKRSWLSIVIWLVLSLWVLWEIFGKV